MPAQLAYPGVYIEEVQGTVRTITSTGTSITAFVGRARRGSVNKAVRVQSFGQFEREFGGLWRHSTMSYAVQHFFQNGGGDSVIVRLCNGASKSKLTLGESSSALVLEAQNEGTWGNKLRASVTHDVSDDLAEQYGLKEKDLFNLTVTDTATGTIEEFRNVSVKQSPRRIDDVLSNRSKLVRVASGSTLPAAVPAVATAQAFIDGSEGDELTPAHYNGSEAGKAGIYALDEVDLFNILCIPPISDEVDVPTSTLDLALSLCTRKRAMLIIDAPKNWTDIGAAKSGMSTLCTRSANGAVFFPRVMIADPLQEGRVREFAPCGAVAGVMARTDAQYGVWKAPAGVNATLSGIHSLALNITDDEQGQLNPLGINCFRSLPAAGNVVFGSRTLKGADQLASEFKYVPVRRLTLHIEENLYRGTQFAVFEGNDQRLWSSVTYAVTSFMHGLFRQGAFQGRSAAEAYFVKCDSDTTNQDDINRGIVNVLVGFAPLKPAEFVVIKLQQIAGQA